MTSIHDAMRAAGLAPAKELELPEGKLVRFRVAGDKGGSRNGWAVRYSDAGSFGSWKTGESHTWHAQSSTPQTPAERAALQQRVKAMQQLRADEQTAVHALARKRAATLWELAKPANNSHPYLQRKHVPAIGIRQLNKMLVIPARDTIGVLHTLQFISEDGSKRFLTGGRITGCYFSIGKVFDSLLITEGLATASTLYLATGRAVAVCFSCSNMAPVARALRVKFPRLRLTLCADNDFMTAGNPGVTHARAAAQDVDGFLAVPQFAEVAP